MGLVPPGNPGDKKYVSSNEKRNEIKVREKPVEGDVRHLETLVSFHLSSFALNTNH
jgi:hypothetical protein